MARTLVRQDKQVRESEVYDDTVVPSEANFETLPANLQDDLNNLRSITHALRDGQTSDWWNPLTAPTGLEPGAIRGVQQLNQALHLLETKRWLREVPVYSPDIVIPIGDNFLVLGTGELPPQLTAAVGAVGTLGTVLATHPGTIGTHSLATVAGSSALSPANLVTVSEGDSRDPIFSQNRRVWGLFQSESTLSDGGTITDSSPSRVQISFVIVSASGTGFGPAVVSDVDGNKINYCFRERVRLKDLLEGDLLKGAFSDDLEGGAGGGSGITESEHELLDTLTHHIVEDSYDEVLRNAKGRITGVITWTDSGKTTKIRESQITRTCGRVSKLITIQYDAASTEIYRVVEDVTRGTTFDDNFITDVDRTRT